MLLGVYFVTNLVLAVVYDSFKSEVRSSIVLLRVIGNHCHHVIVSIARTFPVDSSLCTYIFIDLFFSLLV